MAKWYRNGVGVAAGKNEDALQVLGRSKYILSKRKKRYRMVFLYCTFCVKKGEDKEDYLDIIKSSHNIQRVLELGK